MDHKTLVNRFTKACCRFEAIQEDIDTLLVDTDNEIKYYEYEGLASQAAEIVLKLSANGKNVGMNFYNYYLCRLEYIIDYFRALLDYEETPLALDEPNELDDEPAAVEEDDSEDEQSDEGDEEGDSAVDEDDTPISEKGRPLPPVVKQNKLKYWHGWNNITSEERARARETYVLFDELKKISVREDFLEAADVLESASTSFLEFYITYSSAQLILDEESELRGYIWEAIDAIPGFRDSEKFKELIERFPTYKE